VASGSRALGAVVIVALSAGAAVAQTRGRAATLKVTGAAPGAVVSVDGIRHGRVDAGGAKQIDTIPPGHHTVVVRQTGFADSTDAVVLVAGRTAVVTPKRVPIKDAAVIAYQRATDLALDGKSEDAAHAYRSAIDARGRPYPEAQIGLARALLDLKRSEEATAAVASAISADPRNVEAHSVLGNVLRERGLYDEAAAEYRKAIAIAPTRAPEAHTGLALVLDEKGDHAHAVEEYRKAIAQNQDADPVLYQLLGNSLEQIDRRKDAIAAYERFLALAPSHTLAPAVRSIVKRLREDRPTDEGDVNPYAPK
jgi:tetratricopeptide (TPR) repeat protein